MPDLRTVNRIFPFLAGIFGAAGVALAAAASHGGDTRLLGSASTMCLAHAPVLLGLYLAEGRLRTSLVAGTLLGIGTLLFTFDLLSRHFLQASAFPMAAPIGGLLMIAGWLSIAVGAFFGTKER